MVVIVCNDQIYGAEHVQFTNRKMDPALSMIAKIDFAQVAQSLGLIGVRVTDETTLGEAVDAITRRDRPVLVDLRLDPTKIEM
jgi:thiamine pyrophosphate-dependent acetolactate synthase large subunit-like protein